MSIKKTKAAEGKTMRKIFINLGIAACLVFIIIMMFVTTADVADGYLPSSYETIFSLAPPVIAIVLALITKEVYSSLFVGILVGAFYACSDIRGVSISGFLHRNQLGDIQYPDSYSMRCFPGRVRDARYLNIRLSGRICVRGPLFSYIGYHDHVICRSTL